MSDSKSCLALSDNAEKLKVKNLANANRQQQSKFPSPAVGATATTSECVTDNAKPEDKTSTNNCPMVHKARSPPGTLPDSAANLSNAARGLLLRLLDLDPRVRMRNLRQMQQCAFFMGFNFEHVKAKKISPKYVLDKYFPNGTTGSSTNLCGASEEFQPVEQPTFV